jgi:hypothetical protein
MSASLAELKFFDGVPSLYCPATGRLVHSSERGTDTECTHSPHLRFVLDWVGNAYVVMPDVLPEEQAAYQRELLRVLGAADDAYENDNARIAACCALMPESALVMEVLDPPQGSFDGEIAYFGFDLAPLSAELTDVRLEAIPRGMEAGDDDAISAEIEPDPRVAPFGYFGTDQFGEGMFRWAATTQGLLARYVHEDLLAGLLEDEEVGDAVSTLHEGWARAGVGLGDVVAQLNRVTGDESTVVWCGTFGEIAGGDGEFAREVRGAWRQSRAGCSSPIVLAANETADGPVPDEAFSEFVAYLATYGH